LTHAGMGSGGHSAGLRPGAWRLRGRSVALADELDVKDEFRFWGNDGRAAYFAIGELIRDVEATLAADAHSFEAGIPAGDDAVRTVGKGDGLLVGMIVGGVELGAVRCEVAGVLDGVPLLRQSEVAGADPGVDIGEGVAEFWATVDRDRRDFWRERGSGHRAVRNDCAGMVHGGGGVRSGSGSSGGLGGQRYGAGAENERAKKRFPGHRTPV